MSRKKKTKKTTKNLDGGHTIPTLPPPSGINQGIMNRSEYEESAIRQYVETQAPGEKVTYLDIWRKLRQSVSTTVSLMDGMFIPNVSATGLSPILLICIRKRYFQASTTLSHFTLV